MSSFPPGTHFHEPGHVPSPGPSYTFRLDQYQVEDTRSRNNDTNVVGYTVTVGGSSYTQTLPPTDVNNGNHDIGLEVPGIQIADPTTEVTIAFTIVNAGHNSTAVEAALEKGVDTLIKAEAGNNLLISTAMLGVDAALAVFLADCDGTVAADSLIAERSAFDTTIPSNGRVQTHTKHYPGTDSSTGCGGNSSYYVTQTIVKTEPGDVHQPQPGKYFIIAGRSSGLVLDVPGGLSAAGVQIQQYPDNGTASQHWVLAPVQGEDGYFMITTALNGMVLEVANQSLADHAKIQLATPDGTENQHWMFEREPNAGVPDLPIPGVLPNTNIYYRIRSRSSGEVFDVPNDSADQQAKIQQYPSPTTGYKNCQLWQLLSIGDVPLLVTTPVPPPPVIFRK
jgi:hypothetical protein